MQSRPQIKAGGEPTCVTGWKDGHGELARLSILAPLDTSSCFPSHAHEHVQQRTSLLIFSLWSEVAAI